MVALVKEESMLNTSENVYYLYNVITHVNKFLRLFVYSWRLSSWRAEKEKKRQSKECTRVKEREREIKTW